jgi:hypothetical protein
LGAAIASAACASALIDAGTGIVRVRWRVPSSIVSVIGHSAVRSLRWDEHVWKLCHATIIFCLAAPS